MAGQRSRDLILAVGLCLLVLLYSLYERVTQLGAVLDSAAGIGILRDFLAVPALTDDWLWFLVAQVGLHCALAVGVWSLALATDYAGALPRLQGWRSVLLWLIACIFWIGLANAQSYPRSAGWAGIRLLHFDVLPGVSSFAVMSTLMAVAIGYVSAIALWRSRWRHLAIRCVTWTAVASLIVIVLAKLPDSNAGDGNTATGAKPNIIIIGIDSLRSDLSGQSAGRWLTPNIDGFLKQARVVPDTFSPLARTFPAWISILTGNHPQSTGARENLIPKQSLRITTTLAERLRTLGYRTVFATDEVRFSNIDASYGFDTTVTPTVGAADFLLGEVNDLPLSNLVVNTRLGSFLFPASYANRGAAVTYRPETFIEQLEAEIDFESPLFLALHLTLPHWPFRWADEKSSVFDRGEEYPYPYLAAVVGVDRQFAQLMSLLEERGALTNSIVVVLSDHGEGLGLPTDNLLYSRAAKQAVGRVPVAMWGHGTSVLSPYQYGVLLAWRGFGPAQLAVPAGQPVDVPATLEDVTPTLLDLLGALQATDRFDGRSLAGALRGEESARSLLANRFRYLETAYNVAALSRGDMRESELIREGKRLYGINPSTARIEFRQELWADLLRLKERAVVQGDWLLAALPRLEDNRQTYILVNRRGGLPRRIERAPDATREPTVAALWRALHERFPGELPAEPMG